jgi:hypothetical protein
VAGSAVTSDSSATAANFIGSSSAFRVSEATATANDQATCGLSTSRKKFGRHLGLFLLVQHAHVDHGLVLASVRAKQEIPAIVLSKKNQGFGNFASLFP